MTARESDPQIILDLSRLLSRIFHATPTGVDRCEMAYARGLLASMPDRLSFAAVHPTGQYGRLPKKAVVRFLDATEERWSHRGFSSVWDMRRFATSALVALRPRSAGTPRSRSIYLQVSPNNLTTTKRVQSILKREQAKFVCMLHDLIPLEFPEYARPDGAAKHRKRIETIANLADGIIANSHATLGAIQPYLERFHRKPASIVAHLGVQAFGLSSTEISSRPYFVCIGTIEPRKNHLLLLNLWRRMAEKHGAAAIPQLIIIGRRGWENEQVVDMLERCPSLIGCVEERNDLPDRETQSLLSGARALLLPSFAEGYGMPITEALALKVPVVCTDLPALREAGGAVPMFLDPLDGPAWLAAIDNLTEPLSSLRKDQLRRLGDWQKPTWSAHIAMVEQLLHRVGAS